VNSILQSEEPWEICEQQQQQSFGTLVLAVIIRIILDMILFVKRRKQTLPHYFE
jgi:hypothetical protein